MSTRSRQGDAQRDTARQDVALARREPAPRLVRRARRGSCVLGAAMPSEHDERAVRRIFPTARDACEAGAASFVEHARRAVRDRGIFTVALSGGETPRPMYALLAERVNAAAVPWDYVHLFWGDDRAVPPDHPRSNYRMAKEAFVDHVPIPAANVHRARGELPADEAAELYELELRSVFGDVPRPELDLVHLGIGEDGHTASLFPGDPALEERARNVVSSVDRSHDDEPRVTFTFPLVNAARRVEVLVLEPEKAEIVRRVLHGDEPAHVLPARGVAPAGAHVWLMTEAVARALPPGAWR